MNSQKGLYPATCIICGCRSRRKNFKLPAIIFNYLEGSPAICERCIFEKLTLNRFEWKKEIKELIEEKEIA